MKCSLAFFVAVFLGACTAPSSEKEITIKGKVQFPDNQFNMEIVERNGFDTVSYTHLTLPTIA